jgi:hypothetical protein
MKLKVKAVMPISDGVTYDVASHDAREGFCSGDENDDEEDAPPSKTEETHVAEGKRTPVPNSRGN